MIHASGLTKQYGTKILFRNGAFQINTGEKIGLVGPNGNGKTTIFKMLNGEEGYDNGSITIPDRIRVSYFAQDIEDMHGKTVLEEVASCIPELNKAKTAVALYEAKLSEEMSEDEMMAVLEKYGEAQSEFERLGGYDVDSRAAEILTGLGFPKEDHQNDTSTYSGGWKMRIALAKVLLQNPDVLLMDEPTNHLDLESIMWLEQWLIQYKGALLMTSHDRDFLNRIINKVIEVAHQKITTYSGNYDFYVREKSVRQEQLEAAAKRQEDMLAKEEEFIARFAARASHAAQVQSRVKKIDKIERIELIEDEKSVHFEWPTAIRGGEEVVKFENLGKIWKRENQNEKRVFTGANGLVKRMDRIAVVGINGAGKSTLLKMICGHTDPTEGKVQIGASIQYGYFSQNSLDVLDPNNTVLEEVHNSIPNQGLGYVRNLLGALKFSGDQVEKKIKFLSGGEKSRVVLATIIARPINLLILDEPTNHLDIQTREFLLESLKKFEGTIMIVSHDRYFLKALTTKVFELDQNKLIVTEGSLDYYLEKRKQSLQG